MIAATGQTPDDIGMIHALSQSVPVFFSANMSLGAALLGDLVRRAAAVFPDADIEIVEIHRAGKSDAPSGTALMLADQVIGVRPGANPVYGHTGHGKRKKDDIGIHSVRMGNAAGSHTVYIASDSQVLVLSHTVQSRSVFAEGALRAAEFLIGRTPGLYSVNDLLYGECGENGDKRGCRECEAGERGLQEKHRLSRCRKIFGCTSAERQCGSAEVQTNQMNVR